MLHVVDVDVARAKNLLHVDAVAPYLWEIL